MIPATNRRFSWTLIALLVAACAEPDPARPAEPTSPSVATPSAASDSAASQARPAPAPAQGATSNAPPGAGHGSSVLSFGPQPGWVEEPPANAMRLAQYRLPKQAGDSEDAQLVVFHFGAAGGGGFEQNLERWVSQMEQPDGSDTASKLVHGQRQVGGVTIRSASVTGTLVAETMPGSGERHHKPGFQLMGAMLEVTGTTPYYAKLTGPQKTVAHWTSSWEAFLTAAASGH
jgi:hypothetical protein